MMEKADPFFRAACRYTSFSLPAKFGRLWTTAWKRSWKARHSSNLPENSGGSRAFNLAPEGCCCCWVDADDPLAGLALVMRVKREDWVEARAWKTASK